MTKELIARLCRKAKTSNCNYRVAAMGFNRRGELICTRTNKSRFCRYGGSVHAEMAVMREAGPGLRTIVICRVNKNGKLLSIEPCKVCREKAEELGIKIVSVQEG
jgi:cytidine deaminase